VLPYLAKSGEKHIGRQFYIRYDKEEKKYKIKDLGEEFGVFWKLDQTYKIGSNDILKIGKLFIQF